MINHDLIIGIDPGAGGGIVYYKEGIVKAVRMPMVAKDMQEYLKYLKSISEFPIVFIESLAYRRSDRNYPGKDFQIQKMLSHYERLCTTMQLTDILYIPVFPVTWQTYLHLKISKEEEHDERKRRYKIAAQHYYPKLKVTLWNCDALLLIEFGRRKLKFDMDWIIDKLPEGFNRKSGMVF